MNSDWLDIGVAVAFVLTTAGTAYWLKRSLREHPEQAETRRDYNEVLNMAGQEVDQTVFANKSAPDAATSQGAQPTENHADETPQY